jgi:membrane fusion protein (multidrug efflux system)
MTSSAAETTATTTSATPVAVPAKKAGNRRFIFMGVAATLAIAGTSYWAYQRQFEDTDDAQVDTNMSNISPRVSGTITTVKVIENQRVNAGDVLAEIDPRDLKVAVALAKAQVAEAQAQLAVEDPSVSITEMSNKTTVLTSGSDIASAAAALASAKKSVDQIAAQLAQAQANDKNIQLEKQRTDHLIKEGAVPQSEADTMTAQADASSANVLALKQALEAARAGVGEQEARLASTQSHLIEVKANAPRELETKRASVLMRQAALDAAKAQLDQAELNLSYAEIVSPVTGIVGKKGISVGDHVAPGQEIMAISETDAPWITANFRETQLKNMHPGQSADVYVDALDATLHGSVESIGGATGSRYSVLPPENASGNYVKVVQRIPVRIKLDPGQPGIDRLRAGMSVEPKVRL